MRRVMGLFWVIVAMISGCGSGTPQPEAPVEVAEPEQASAPTEDQREETPLADEPAGPGAAWVGVLSGEPTAVPHDIAATPDGGLVVVGGFFDQMDIDPGPGEDRRDNHGAFDAFILGVDAQGQRRWDRTFGGSGDDVATDVAVLSDGSIVVAGQFEGTVNFDNGAGVVERTSNGDLDVYVLVLDSAGVLQWVATYGGAGDNRVGGVAVAADSSIILSGYFYDVVDLDAGPGLDERHSAGGRDVFVLRLGSEGRPIWARTYGGPGEDFAFEVAAAADGSCFLGGRFNSRADFDPGPGTQERSAGGADDDAYVLALGPAGSFGWVRVFGGLERQEISALAVDAEGGVYVGGLFDGTLDLDPSRQDDDVIVRGGHDTFVVHLAGDGSVRRTTVWSGSEDDVVMDIAPSPDGSLLVVGWFEDKLDLDPGRGVFEPRVRGRSDGFSVLLGPDGAFRWAWSLGGNEGGGVTGAVALGDDSFAVVGHFSGLVDFDPGPDQADRDARGMDDAFIVMLTDI